MPLSEEDATLRLQALARGYIGRLRAIAALNDVWEKVPDLKQGHACYYYNRRTDESSWDKPRLLVALLGPMGDLDEVASPYTEDQAATLVQSAWRRRMAQQIVRLAVAQEWSKAHDEDSGASYYYNARTGEASWVKPVLLGGQDLEDFADHLRLRQEEKEPETYESYDEVGNWVVWQRNADFGDEWVALGWYDPAGNWVDAASAWEAPKEEDAKGAPRRKRMGSGPRRYPRSQAQAAVDAAEDATDNAVDMAERLDLSGLNAHRISARVYSLTRLRHLSLRGNCLTRLSPDISLLVNLTELDCSCNKLKRLPDSLEGLLHLRSLLCAGNCITSKGIPGNVYTLPNLEILDLSENQLDRLPVEVGNVQLLKTTREWEVGVGHLKMLRVLKLSRNALEEYPQQLEKCTRLEELYLDGNKVASVPPAVQQNSALQLLRLEGNRLTDLPVSINMLSELRHLDVSSNKLTDLTLLPPPRGHITQLSALIARDNQITAAPQALSNMLSLRILDLKGNPLGHNLKLEALRKLQIIRLAACNVEANEPALSGFASLTKVEELDLSYNGIPRIPSRTFSGFGHLKELDLGHNQLRTLESESGVGALMQLETLSLRFNRLRELPDDLCRLTALKRLHVRGNELVALPEKLGRLTRLTVLDVGSNLLTALPASTCALTALEELRLDSNKLVELPLSLSPLQSLRMLDLSHNLPPVISKWPKLVHLILNGNPIQNWSRDQWKALLFSAEKGVSALLQQDYDEAVVNLRHAACTYEGLMQCKQTAHTELRLHRQDLDYSYHYHLGVACLLRAQKPHAGQQKKDSNRAPLDDFHIGSVDTAADRRRKSDLNEAVQALERAEDIRILSRALNLPGEVYMARGKANAALGRHDRAITDFEKASRALPRMLALREMRLSSREALGQFDRAELEARHLVKILEEEHSKIERLILEAVGTLEKAQTIIGPPAGSDKAGNSSTYMSEAPSREVDGDNTAHVSSVERDHQNGEVRSEGEDAGGSPAPAEVDGDNPDDDPARVPSVERDHQNGEAQSEEEQVGDFLPPETVLSSQAGEMNSDDEDRSDRGSSARSKSAQEGGDGIMQDESHKEHLESKTGDSSAVAVVEPLPSNPVSPTHELEQNVMRLEAARDDLLHKISAIAALEQEACSSNNELSACVDMADIRRGYEIGPTGAPIRRRLERMALLRTGESELRYAWELVSSSARHEDAELHKAERLARLALAKGRQSMESASVICERSKKVLEACHDQDAAADATAKAQKKERELAAEAVRKEKVRARDREQMEFEDKLAAAVREMHTRQSTVQAVSSNSKSPMLDEEEQMELARLSKGRHVRRGKRK